LSRGLNLFLEELPDGGMHDLFKSLTGRLPFGFAPEHGASQFPAIDFTRGVEYPIAESRADRGFHCILSQNCVSRFVSIHDTQV
jgi:hypothetical protein